MARYTVTGLLALLIGCGPNAAAPPDAAVVVGDPDAADPLPEADAGEDTLSAECAEAAARRSYDGCEFLAVDLDNAIGVSGGEPVDGDCSSFGEGVVLLAGVEVCVDAADVNDDSGVNITDAISCLGFLFNGGVEPRSPFPDCGEDPTADSLECATQGACD